MLVLQRGAAGGYGVDRHASSIFLEVRQVKQQLRYPVVREPYRDYGAAIDRIINV